MASSDHGDGSIGDDLGSMATVLGALAEAPGGGRAEPLVAGETVAGRYLVGGPLGRGGMGVVYRARDVRLEREVALKLCTARSADALARLEAEAVALAKLSHPNVVVIHEVGEVNGRVFIAMEYVAAGTARRWLAMRPRTWREIVALYTAAGDGLAAAHAAGLVHRDFKPDNVLVGEDGRPRVADFGLASGDAITGSETITHPEVAGTPAYMAPEQVAGGDVGARADQYAFCATVWEGLVGVRPYPKTPAPDATVDAPSPLSRRSGPDVAGHVVEALRRGLRPAAADRWPSLTALIAELRRDPAARRRRIAITVGITAVAAAAGVAITLGVAGGDTEPCEDGAALFAPAWNPARANALAARFTEARAERTWTMARGRLEAFSTSWIAGHRSACRATRVHGSQSEAMLERRTLCLADARARLDAGLSVLERAPPENLADAMDVVAALPELERCDDVTALGAQAPLPADPAMRARMDTAITQIAAAKMSRFALPDLELAGRALAAARESGWSPLVAEATHVLGGLQRDRGDPAAAETQRTAASLALASGSDELAAWAMADLAWNAAEDVRTEDAKLWGGLAHGLWTRIGEPARLGVRVIGAEALTAMTRGAPAEGLVATRRQVALALVAFPDDPISIAANHKNLAHALMWAGELTEARIEMEHAIELATAALGDGHPMLARYHELAASIVGRAGDPQAAVAHARRTMEIVTKWYGADTLVVADAQEVLGGALLRTTAIDEACAVLERVIAIRERAGATPTNIANALSNLAAAEIGRGNLDRAFEVVTRALGVLESVHGSNHLALTQALVNLGYVERGRKHLPESTRHLERAVAITDAALGPDHVETINPRIELANTLVAAGKPAAAVAALTPALALMARDPEIPRHVAGEARLVFAEAAWRSGDRAAARTAALAGRDDYLALGEAFAEQHAAAEAWLRAHGGLP